MGQFVSEVAIVVAQETRGVVEYKLVVSSVAALDPEEEQKT